MPIFRDRSSGTCLGITLSVRDRLPLATLASATGEETANSAVSTVLVLPSLYWGLPTVVRERLVGFGHPMGVFASLH